MPRSMLPVLSLVVVLASACQSANLSKGLADAFADEVFSKKFPARIAKILDDSKKKHRAAQKATEFNLTQTVKVDDAAARLISYKLVGPEDDSKFSDYELSRIGLEGATLRYSGSVEISQSAFLERLKERIQWLAVKETRSTANYRSEGHGDWNTRLAIALPDPTCSLTAYVAKNSLRVYFKQIAPEDSPSISSPQERCDHVRSLPAFKAYESIALGKVDGEAFDWKKKIERADEQDDARRVGERNLRLRREAAARKKAREDKWRQVWAHNRQISRSRRRSSKSSSGSRGSSGARKKPSAKTTVRFKKSPSDLAAEQRSTWLAHSGASTSALETRYNSFRVRFFPDFDAGIEGVPVELDFKWSIDTLLGSPVVSCQARWKIVDSGSTPAVNVRLPTKRGYKMTLVKPPLSVLNKIRIYDVEIKTRLKAPGTLGSVTYYHDLDPGVMAGAGSSLSFNVPGSPRWDRLFKYSSDQYIEEKFSKPIVVGMKKQRRDFALVPESFLSLKFNLSAVKEWMRENSLEGAEKSWMAKSQDYDSQTNSKWASRKRQEIESRKN